MKKKNKLSRMRSTIKYTSKFKLSPRINTISTNFKSTPKRAKFSQNLT